MKKLSILFACAAMSLTLGVAGCKKKKDEAAKTETAPKTEEMKKDETKAEPPKTDDKGAAATPTAGGDLPAECNDYKAMIEKLASCDKLPQQSRDALKQGYDTMAASWKDVGAMPAEAKKAMGDACKQGAEALKTAASAACGW